MKTLESFMMQLYGNKRVVRNLTAILFEEAQHGYFHLDEFLKINGPSEHRSTIIKLFAVEQAKKAIEQGKTMGQFAREQDQLASRALNSKQLEIYTHGYAEARRQLAQKQ